MLVIATVVGGGMFSLPIAMAGVWFPGASVILLFIAIMMLLTGLMLVEVNLHYGAGASFNTFTPGFIRPEVEYRGWYRFRLCAVYSDLCLYLRFVGGDGANRVQIQLACAGEYLGGDRQYAGRAIAGIVPYWSDASLPC